jgi:hypothetical protein
MKTFGAGIGGTTGDQVAVASKYLTTGDVWYVNSATGVDAASPAGKQRTAPLATVAQAITNAANDGDDIVCLAGHTETLTSAIAINKTLRIIGEGSGIGSMPKFIRNHGSNGLVTMTAGSIELRNLYFPAGLLANATARVALGNSTGDSRVIGCYFDCGATDTGAALSVGTCLRARIENCTFVSTSVTTAPHSAIALGSTNNDICIIGCTLSGGTKGWSNQYALDATGAVCTRLRIESLSLLLDSDVGLHASTVGSISLGVCSGSARVVHA